MGDVRVARLTEPKSLYTVENIHDIHGLISQDTFATKTELPVHGEHDESLPPRENSRNGAPDDMILEMWSKCWSYWNSYVYSRQRGLFSYKVCGSSYQVQID